MKVKKIALRGIVLGLLTHILAALTTELMYHGKLVLK